MSSKNDPRPLCHSVAESLEAYFGNLNGHQPKGLYETILTQVEPPLPTATLPPSLGHPSRGSRQLPGSNPMGVPGTPVPATSSPPVPAASPRRFSVGSPSR